MEIIVSNFGELLAGIGTLLAALFGGIKLIIHFSNRGIHKKLENIKEENIIQRKENLDQHDKIQQTLNILEDSLVRKALIDELRAIVRGYIHYNKTMEPNTKILIDAQGERVVEIAEEIITERFTPDMLEAANIKIDGSCMRARQQVVDLFNDVDLSAQYAIIQRDVVNRYFEKLKKLANDNIVNSKYARFGTLCTGFLHDLISETLRMIHEWEMKKILMDNEK